MVNKLKMIIIAMMILLSGVLALNACDGGGSHAHQYGEWVKTKVATCIEAGEEARYCSCGDVQTKEIPIVSHSYGTWKVATEATCVEDGMYERVCACGDKQTKALPAGHNYGDWVVTTEATCGQTGEKYATCTKCNDKKIESIPKSTTHTYGRGTMITNPTCTEQGSKKVTCTVCNVTNTISVSALGHQMSSAGKCSRCGLVTFTMTSDEIAKSKKVKNMSHSVSEYYDEIVINMTFKDSSSNNLQIPVYVDVRIVDDDGNTVYNKTLVKKPSQSKVTIDYDEVKNATTETGTLYYTVYNDYVKFGTVSKELEKIPWTVEIELPNVPQTISYNGYSATSSCRVTGITYKVSNDDVTFYFTGEKTYDKNGNNYSQSCKIGWKLYDSNGYVVADGTCYTTAIRVGEKFKDADDTAYNVIEQGETYRLVIMNVS